MISLEPKENVDESFVTIVERILNCTLRLHPFEEVYVVLIDNWFDHKWLEFKSSHIDNDVLGWRAKLKLPPFEPCRVMDQSCFRKHTSGVCRYERTRRVGCIIRRRTDRWLRFFHQVPLFGIRLSATTRIVEASISIGKVKGLLGTPPSSGFRIGTLIR